MATLILGNIGGIVGGPVGAAIGATLGRVIDGEIFRPPGREGPRLAELRVQTSSYGAALPRLFGRVRTAGVVIWATDLIETRSTSRAGKGQPSVTSFSYAASFAVALSARPILRVERIWADGKLLRGAAGDFKTRTGFRLHTGGEDQPGDPLILAAEGAAPAHRGLAYAVFETLQLADFGNRIPSLSFEVVADDGPVAPAAIAAAASDGLILADAALPPVAGFAIEGASARAVIAPLAEAVGGWARPSGRHIALAGPAPPARTLADGQVAARDARPVRTRWRRQPIEAVPLTLSVAHYDPARDYLAGVQRARRPGPGEGAARIDLPATLAAPAAKALAESLLAARAAARERRRLALDWRALDLPPGAVVALDDAPGLWRVSGWALEEMVLTLDLVRLAPGAAPAPASAGRAVAAPDLASGETRLIAFEAPPLDHGARGGLRLYVAAAGSAPGWRRAALLLSSDGGARFEAAGPSAAPAVIGTVTRGAPARGAALRDLASAIEVTLAHPGMMLTDADDAALDAGANLARVGDELLQFGSAEPVGGARWRLRRLLRGRRASEPQAVLPGAPFLLIEPDALRAFDLPQSVLGGEALVLASGTGDAEPARAAASLSGVSLLPPAPVGLRCDAVPGGVRLRWARRLATGGVWRDGGDVPLIEEREAYRLIIDGTAVETGVPVADWPRRPRRIELCQIGTHGAGPVATFELGDA